MTKDVPSVQAAIGEIEDALADLLDCGDRCRRPVARIMRSLKELKSFTGAAADGGFHQAPASSGPVHQTRKQPKEYMVRTVRGRAMLAEIRAGGRNPFYCPKDVLEAVARAFVGADQPMDFNEILARVTPKLGRRPPDFHVRVCLRFLSDPRIGLIERDRARYTSQAGSTIFRKVQAAWDRMATRD